MMLVKLLQQIFQRILRKIINVVSFLANNSFYCLQLNIFLIEKVSDILKLFFNSNIDIRGVYDLYADNVNEFIYKNLDEIQNDL